MQRLVSWFSCGVASAVNTKLAIARYGETHEIAIVRCLVPEEHDDNARFSDDCERWFGRPVIKMRSAEYASCEDVWRRTRYMSGIRGARCTIEMKKVVRWAFEQDWLPDLQAFGYTADEKRRVEWFRRDNPEINLVSCLVDSGLTKDDCHALIERAGIKRPAMYDLGFPNANCIGCVNAQSPGYWNRVRDHFPDVFARRASLSRELGVRLVKETAGARPRRFLDELDPADVWEDPAERVECSLLCALAEHDLKG